MVELTPPTFASIGRLEREDVSSAAALSAAVGWNQNEEDWARLVELHPEGAFAARVDGELVGTTTLVSYGDALAWLGMVIVHPERRGGGIGSALVDTALAGAPSRVIGLDATDLGAPLYERRGFTGVATIDRWSGVLRAEPARRHHASVRSAGAGDVDRIARFDSALSGLDRVALLSQLASEAGTTLVFAERGGTVAGFAALRSGRERPHVGPIVVFDDEALHVVINELASRTAGEHVFLDAVRQEHTSGRLEAFGLQVARSLRRMTRPAAPEAAMMRPELVAAMGLEWG